MHRQAVVLFLLQLHLLPPATHRVLLLATCHLQHQVSVPVCHLQLGHLHTPALHRVFLLATSHLQHQASAQVCLLHLDHHRLLQQVPRRHLVLNLRRSRRLRQVPVVNLVPPRHLQSHHLQHHRLRQVNHPCHQLFQLWLLQRLRQIHCIHPWAQPLRVHQAYFQATSQVMLPPFPLRIV